MTTDQFISCSDCGHQYVLDIEERQAEGGKLDIGHECPMCHTWYHSFFTTPELQRQADLVNKFRDKASKSLKDLARYRRKLAQYRQSFALVNPPRS